MRRRVETWSHCDETLELGGTSAAILLEVADIDTFLAGIGMASFMKDSQTCRTQSRILGLDGRRGPRHPEAINPYLEDTSIYASADRLG